MQIEEGISIPACMVLGKEELLKKSGWSTRAKELIAQIESMSPSDEHLNAKGEVAKSVRSKLKALDLSRVKHDIEEASGIVKTKKARI